MDLNTCRNFETGPIPWTAIDSYFRRHGGVDADAFHDLRLVIRGLDKVFRDHMREKREREREQNKTKPRPK